LHFEEQVLDRTGWTTPAPAAFAVAAAFAASTAFAASAAFAAFAAFVATRFA